MLPLFPLLTSHKVQTGPLQSCACSFLRAHELLSGDFWSLPLSLLPLVYQVLCFLFITYPFTYYPACTEKIIGRITLMNQMLSPSTYPYSHHDIRAMCILKRSGMPCLALKPLSCIKGDTYWSSHSLPLLLVIC